MSSDSFDPRSWHKQHKPEADPASGRDAPAPDFWREAAGEHGAADVDPGRSRARKTALPLILAGVAALALGGVWLLSFRSDDAPAATLAAGAEIATVERGFKVADPAEIGAQLVKLGVPTFDAEAVARAAIPGFTSSGEHTIDIALSESAGAYRVERFLVTAPDTSKLLITRAADGGYVSKAIAATVQQKIFVLRGQLDDSSFYSSAIALGVDETLVPEFINAFAYDFNLASEIVPGDSFEVGFRQAVTPEGKAVGQPTLVFALLSTPAKTRAIYRFQAQGGEAAWFDGDGASTKRGLMKTPVDGARLSSVFGLRFHPKLKYTRPHRGIDLAAPTGTAIFAAADGEVVFAALKGNNGNFTILKHADNMETYYLHQSRFMPGIVPGAHVMQGQKIGEIGTTGLSTGPHLHYEVHINNEPVDPLSVPTDDAKRKRLDGGDLREFKQQRDEIDRERADSGG